MGVDTKAVLTKGTTIIDIEKKLSEKYTDVSVWGSTVWSKNADYMEIYFRDGDHKRKLSVSFKGYIDDGIEGVSVSLGHWGNAVEILKYLCESFGGYLNENDCDAKGFYPINFHLFSQGTGFTKIDLFKHKVIKEVGYDKLGAVMSLLDEYLDLQD